MRSVQNSNQRAKEIVNGNYRYLYGAKGQTYTSALVNKFAAAYPSVFTESLKAEALKDADKDYTAIDCSGFVCDVLGVAAAGSAQMRSAAITRLPVSKQNAKEGMAIWKNGHIAYVGDELKIYEAASTAADMKVSSFESRARAFTELLIVKGSALASTDTIAALVTSSANEATSEVQETDSVKNANPYVGPTKTVTSAAQAKAKGVMQYISSGEGVKWVQWELNEAGYNLAVDGVAGKKTVAAIIAFQASCKITADGLAGVTTRKYLKAE